MASSRYRFGEFVVYPRRRQLLRDGTPVPLIPRYFDLLLLLLDRRDEAIDRREIFDRVWADVVVSDGALTQAIRTLRRAIGDDPRDSRYIRTVSRHGYRFVFDAVIVELDGSVSQRPAVDVPIPVPPRADDDSDGLIQRLIANGSDEDRRDAAEQLGPAPSNDSGG